jgi:hypothetical protein
MLSHKMLRILRYGESKYNKGLLTGGLIGYALGIIIHRRKT